MTYYIKNGNKFSVTSEANLDIHKVLPAENFIVQFNEQTETFFLEQVERFNLPGKVYGNTLLRAGRMFNTFQQRPNSTGIMLTGEKGSGKTMLAKLLSLTGKHEGMPTVIINQPWNGDKFNKFIQDISQPAVVLFDEFEKVYDPEDQQAILTLLDGVFQSKKMFVLTCNDKYRVDSHMRNRPGRIFYLVDFKGMEEDAIKEYCEDKLTDKSYINQIVLLSSTFSEFNFDMLQALVEDMNRYNEDPFQVLEILNAKPIRDETEYQITLLVDGQDMSNKIYHNPVTGSPLSKMVTRVICDPGHDADNITYEFNNEDLVSINKAGILYRLKGNRKIEARFVKVEEESFTFDQYKGCF